MLGNRGFPEAWSHLCVCQASFLMTFAMGRVPHAGPRQHFFSMGMVLIPVSCTMSWTSVHSSSGTLSIRSRPLNLFLTPHCIIIRDLIEVILEWSSSFPYFLQFKSEFGNKEFVIWDTVSSQSCFCWLYRASPSLAAKNIINLISVLTIEQGYIKWHPTAKSITHPQMDTTIRTYAWD